MLGLQSAVIVPDLIAGHYQERLLGLVLFGSFARDENFTDSDIDLLVVLADEEIKRHCYREWDQSIAAKLDSRVNPAIVSLPGGITAVHSLWLEVALDGIVIYDRDFKISRFLAQLRNSIQRGIFKRGVSHGAGFWTDARKD